MKNVQKLYKLIGNHFGQKEISKTLKQNRIASDEKKSYAAH